MEKLTRLALIISTALLTLGGALVQAQTTLIPAGSVWKYLDTGVNAGSTWSTPGFDDSSWLSGPAELGYGDGGEATVVSFGPNASTKYTTTYFRQTIPVANANTLGSLDLTLTYDDGAVVYINGTEVWRVNMPAGPISSSTFASGSGDFTPLTTTIPVANLINGNNVVAVEMHQSDLTSSDISFDLSITANLAPTVTLLTPANGAILAGPTNITFTATASDPDGTVARVEYFAGINLLGSSTNAPYTFIWSNVVEGIYSVSAVATDNVGGTSAAGTANITVVDNNPPSLIAALGTTNSVTLNYSKKVSPATALNISNYAVNNGVTVSSATYGSSSNIVVLGTSAIAAGTTNTLTVNNVQDFNGNTIAPNSQIIFTISAVIPVNIGNPALGGTLTTVPGGFEMTAAGTNIFGTSDQFTFGYQQVSGDFDLKIRLQAFNAVDPWAAAGLMARESLNGNSRFAAALTGPNISGAYFSFRTNTAAIASKSGSFPVNYPQTWLRLQRSGTNFNGFASHDGQNWASLGTVSLIAPGSMYVGLATCSANAAQAATVNFRDYQSGAGGVIAPVAFTREPLGPSTRRTGLIFSEIMYHPKDRADGKQLEFVEIYNSMSIFEDVSGYKLTGDVEYTIPNGTVLQPGTFLVLAKVKADVESAYGISGVFEYGIPNGFNTNVVGNTTNITVNY